MKKIISIILSLCIMVTSVSGATAACVVEVGADAGTTTNIKWYEQIPVGNTEIFQNGNRIGLNYGNFTMASYVKPLEDNTENDYVCYLEWHDYDVWEAAFEARYVDGDMTEQEFRANYGYVDLLLDLGIQMDINTYKPYNELTYPAYIGIESGDVASDTPGEFITISVLNPETGEVVAFNLWQKETVTYNYRPALYEIVKSFRFSDGSSAASEQQMQPSADAQPVTDAQPAEEMQPATAVQPATAPEQGGELQLVTELGIKSTLVVPEDTKGENLYDMEPMQSAEEVAAAIEASRGRTVIDPNRRRRDARDPEAGWEFNNNFMHLKHVPDYMTQISEGTDDYVTFALDQDPETGEAQGTLQMFYQVTDISEMTDFDRVNGNMQQILNSMGVKGANFGREQSLLFATGYCKDESGNLCEVDVFSKYYKASIEADPNAEAYARYIVYFVLWQNADAAYNYFMDVFRMLDHATGKKIMAEPDQSYCDLTRAMLQEVEDLRTELLNTSLEETGTLQTLRTSFNMEYNRLLTIHTERLTDDLKTAVQQEIERYEQVLDVANVAGIGASILEVGKVLDKFRLED